MGSEANLEDEVAQELDELLSEADGTRHQEFATAPDASTLTSVHFHPKVDCE